MVPEKTKGSPDYMFDCPGCGSYHGVWTTEKNDRSAVWSFNGNMEKPTFSPSILVRWTRTCPEIKDMVCHSFVTDGMIQYLSDCTHKLAGQTVELPKIENIEFLDDDN